MRSLRWTRVLVQVTLLAVLVCLIPATSNAAVFISVGFAPPVLPVYEQPLCPQDGWMWTPGYWAYGDDGYFWVPGTWVPSPYVGALWTPGYWGWGGGLYVWHGGYWGPHVGYYGGVNYGFGYMGIGFAGGVWAGGAFRYNTAVMRVNTTVIHNTYVDNTYVHNTTFVNNSHVAYSGGPGGINHPPTAQENTYSHEQHTAPTAYQTRQESAARTNVNSYASHNGGHPANVATERPMGGGAHGPASGGGNHNSPNPTTGNHGTEPGGQGAPSKTYNASHSNTSNTPSHSTPQPQTHESHPAPSHSGGSQPHSEGHEKGH